MLRAVIAEDNEFLSGGLELMLGTNGFTVVATVADADSFLEAVDEHRPDVTVVDVRLPPTFRDEGIRAAMEARRRHPDLPVMVFSQYVEREYATQLLAGAPRGIGYLLKDRVSRIDEFIEALRRVAGGGTAFDPEVIAQLLTRTSDDPVSLLTPREREVLALMAEGRDNTEIAGRLFITANAVHKHINAIFGKLGLAPTDGGHRRVLAVLTYLAAPGRRRVN
ncbi:response regulator transcription factor [Actinoplanes sp. NPDC004185]